MYFGKDEMNVGMCHWRASAGSGLERDNAVSRSSQMADDRWADGISTTSMTLQMDGSDRCFDNRG